IYTGAISRNCELLAQRAPLCAVLKADGYGHGALAAARAARAGGADWLAVATAGEAVALREAGIDGRLLVMGAMTPEETGAALAARADVVAWTPEFLAGLPDEARVHVKLDTGMGRLGVKEAEGAAALARAAGERLAGLMTHFATADERGDDYLPAQIERFREWAVPLKGERPDLVLHAANSAATLREEAALFDMVRCGVAIYGLDPFQEDPRAHGLEPALALGSWLAAVRPFQPGESAGYGRSWSAASPTWIGTVPIGYGDGWRRALSNSADVLIGGRRYPLVGTVSMDNVTVDLGPDPDVGVGEHVCLIGSQNGETILAEEVAQRLGTINYEVTCALTPRVRRDLV
ncbi:MAG: alanine racemase, partial [Thermoleophilaceae bacterium]|nr:alanine racemase [Thermoleophilaceae bacterium]